VDPIHPIAPGPPAIPRAGSVPVERAERISRERDRPEADQPQRRRRRPTPPAAPAPARGGEDGEQPHVDVRA
jgi:hypothetical protein